MKWTAHFEDYSIKQFDEDGNEIKYQEVMDNIDNLKLFVIMDNVGNCYSLNLETQEFKYNEILIKKCNLCEPKFSYYRKCTLNIGDKYPFVIQCMGFEDVKHDYFFIEINQQTNQYKLNFN